MSSLDNAYVFLISLLLIRFLRAVKFGDGYCQLSSQHLTLKDILFNFVVTLFYWKIYTYIFIPLHVAIYLFIWCHVLLYRLFQTEIGFVNFHSQPKTWNLLKAICFTSPTLFSFMRKNLLFALFPFALHFEKWSTSLYVITTLIVHWPSFKVSNGRSLIEDTIFKRYPKIPNGYYPKKEHRKLFYPERIDENVSLDSSLKGTSIIFFTFESVGIKYLKMCKNKPFYEKLLNSNCKIIPDLHMCFTPLCEPSLRAIFCSTYGAVNETNISLLNQAGYVTIFMVSRGCQENHVKSIGFKHVIDCSDFNDVLSIGIEQIKKILLKYVGNPFYIHVHSCDTGTPYHCPQSPMPIIVDLPKYLMAIEETDKKFGQFHADFSKTDDILTIISADHGHAFGEDGYYLHGNGLIKETLNLPLIIHHPKLQSSKTVQFSTHFDIFPTIFHLIGIDGFNNGPKLGYSLLLTNRPKCCWFLYSGNRNPCLGIVLNEETKYTIDLVRESCIESDVNDENRRDLINKEERVYYEALIGFLGRYHKILP